MSQWKIKVRKNQVWNRKGHSYSIMVNGFKGGKIKVVILTEKTGVYKGSHTLTPFCLYRNYDLVQ